MPTALPKRNTKNKRTKDAIPYKELEGQHGPYIAEPALVHAANTALGLEMPLLLTGEPGCGKSDFAWVAAKALNHTEPLRFHVRSDTRAKDLLYHYDALLRFGDAQHGDEEARTKARDPRRYISLRELGMALMSQDPRRQVVLVDEIDKAPRDLPNDLLHELDEGSFQIGEISDLDMKHAGDPLHYEGIELKRRMERSKEKPKPFVVITSNAERQLPEAFLRRCIFYYIPPPTQERLIEIAQARFKEPGDPGMDTLKDMATIFHTFREAHHFSKPPTTAEMLNWIDALARLYDAGEVKPTIARFGELARKEADIPWEELPGLSCLLKMAEDIKMVVSDREA